MVLVDLNSESGQMSAIKEVRVVADDQTSKECLKQLNQVFLLSLVVCILPTSHLILNYNSLLSSLTLEFYILKF